VKTKTKKKANESMKNLRKILRMSQPQFAELIGVSPALIASIETGRAKLTEDVDRRIGHTTGATLLVRKWEVIRGKDVRPADHHPKRLTQSHKMLAIMTQLREPKLRLVIEPYDNGEVGNAYSNLPEDKMFTREIYERFLKYDFNGAHEYYLARMTECLKEIMDRVMQPKHRIKNRLRALFDSFNEWSIKTTKDFQIAKPGEGPILEIIMDLEFKRREKEDFSRATREPEPKATPSVCHKCKGGCRVR
jgi:transcriptional regulator with XRE-family HTH domain